MEKSITKIDEHLIDIEILLNHIEKGKCRGIVHVGAHQAEEFEIYLKMGISDFLLIEANPMIFDVLNDKFNAVDNVCLENVAISDSSGFITFNIHKSRSGSVESSSIFEMDQLKKIVESMETIEKFQVPSITLDDLLLNSEKYALSKYNLLVLDIQGAELLALKGAIKCIDFFDYVIVEVNLISMYESGATEIEINNFLVKNGFDRVFSVIHELHKNEEYFPAWGESLYKRIH
jgi:FkbM family methyltransferase